MIVATTVKRHIHDISCHSGGIWKLQLRILQSARREKCRNKLQKSRPSSVSIIMRGLSKNDRQRMEEIWHILLLSRFETLMLSALYNKTRRTGLQAISESEEARKQME